MRGNLQKFRQMTAGKTSRIVLSYVKLLVKTFPHSNFTTFPLLGHRWQA